MINPCEIPAKSKESAIEGGLNENEASIEISPLTTYEELAEYFGSNLPPGVSKKTFKDTACFGIARMVVEQLGGSDRARIFWVEVNNTDGKSGLDMHAYVVATDASPKDLAYCSFSVASRRVNYILENGIDVTEEVMSAPWDNMII